MIEDLPMRSISSSLYELLEKQATITVIRRKIFIDLKYNMTDYWECTGSTYEQ